jgi:EAL domain-containing protein (putative c-di-GMP-specific phosphodiesterase class I)
MVAAITQVAKVMELETVAEYVETKKARKLIEKLGVDFAQGHLIGKPAAIDTILASLDDLTQSSSG